MKKFTLIFLLLFVSLIFPQGQTAVPFLTFQQSAFLQGTGQTGAAVISEDPLGFYYNPAVLGFTAKSNHISSFFLSNKVDWLGAGRVFLNSYGINLGYNFEKEMPVSVGVGFIHNNFDFQLNENDSFDAISIGASLNYPVSFGIGISIKKFNSALDNYPNGPAIHTETSGTAFDIGGIVNVPISKLLLASNKINLNQTTFITPNLNLTLGYSLNNIGNKISYIDPAQADPIPRTARLGYTILIGSKLHFDDSEIDLMNYTFISETSDLLVDENMNYKSWLGDINIAKNLFQLKTESSAIVHKAHIFDFFETIKLSIGRFNGRGYYNVKTSAFVLSTNGFFKLLSRKYESSVFNFIFSHLGIQYTKSKIFIDQPIETEYNGISIFFNNINF